jgi:CheY-like chemotaxis protein
MTDKSTKRRVLLIEDEPLLRDTLREAFEGAGFELTEAANGKEGIRSFETAPADIIVTDILMPEKDGLETIIDLRKRHPGLKILARSGGDRTGNRQYLRIAKEFGAVRVLPKPFRPKEILTVVEEILAAG